MHDVEVTVGRKVLHLELEIRGQRGSLQGGCAWSVHGPAIPVMLVSIATFGSCKSWSPYRILGYLWQAKLWSHVLFDKVIRGCFANISELNIIDESISAAEF